MFPHELSMAIVKKTLLSLVLPLLCYPSRPIYHRILYTSNKNRRLSPQNDLNPPGTEHPHSVPFSDTTQLRRNAKSAKQDR